MNEEVTTEMEEGQLQDIASRSVQPAAFTHPSSNIHTHERGGGRNRRPLYIIAGVAMVVLILSVSLGVGLSNDGSDTKTDKASASASDSKAVVTGPDNNNATVSSSTNFTTTSFNVTSSNITNSSIITDTVGPCDELKDVIRQAIRRAGQIAIDNYAIYEFQSEQKVTADDFTPDDDAFVEPEPVRSADARFGHGRDLASRKTAENTIRPKPWSTNNQHVGVEEPDFVQSNGTNLFIVYGREIVVLKADTLTVTSRTEIPQQDPRSRSWSSSNVVGMLLIEDRLAVFNQEYATTVTRTQGGSSSSSSPSNTTALIYDTATMELVTKITLPATFIGARAVGAHVYAVTSASFDFYQLLESLYPSEIESTPLDEASYREKANEQLELLLDPMVEEVTADLECPGLLKTPSVLAESTDITWSSLATITSFDILSPTNATTTSLLLPSAYTELYASNERLVLLCGNHDSISPGMNNTEAQIYLFPFTLSGVSVTLSSPGFVQGYPTGLSGIDHVKLNGDDYIRVLVASGMPDYYYYDDGFMEDVEQEPVTLQLSVFEMTEGTDTMMPMVGQLAGLGKPDDMAYSTLFQGERAFVSSANETATFYTLNMSDPTNPQKVGSLVLPGIGKSLHDIGQNLVLGIGSKGSTGSPYSDPYSSMQSFELSLFDVSNFSQPRLVQQWSDKPPKDTNISESVFSEIEYDIKAFRYVFERQILIVPMTVTKFKRKPCSNDDDSSWREPDSSFGNATRSSCFHDDYLGTTFDGFRLFKINATSGITPYLSIEHSMNDLDGGGFNRCYSGSGVLSPRSLVMNGDVLTLRGQTVAGFDLLSGAELAPMIHLSDGANCSNTDDFMW